jgi:hypothetical protein
MSSTGILKGADRGAGSGDASCSFELDSENTSRHFGFSNDNSNRMDEASLDFIQEVDDENEDGSNSEAGLDNATDDNEETNNRNGLGIGSKENQDVTIIRLIAFSVLLLSAIVCGIVVFTYVRGSERTKFENQFTQNVHKVFGSMGSKIENTFASIDAFATAIVSHVATTNQIWPYILIPDFPVRAAKTRSITLGVYIETAVLVKANERVPWESFAWENRDWVNKSLVIQKTDPNFFGPSYWNTTATQSIYGDEGDIPYEEM